MKILIVSLLAFSVATKIISQDPHTMDSLTKLLLATSDDNVKASVIADLARETVYTKPDSCLYYTELGLELVNNSSVKRRFERSENFNLYSFEVIMYTIR